MKNAGKTIILTYYIINSYSVWSSLNLTRISSIELECINMAMQRDLESLREATTEIPKLKQKLEKSQLDFTTQLNDLTCQHKQDLKSKKQKYIEKVKSLELKFTQLCEEKMHKIQGNPITTNPIEDLQNSSTQELSSKLITKDREISAIKSKLENEYILITEHEAIVNEQVGKVKRDSALEIDRV